MDADGGRMKLHVIICAGLLFSLQGCVASIVQDVVTAPVKIVSKTADVLTTSQSEADEKRGRDMRKREEALGKLGRQLEKANDRCEDGDRDACEKADDLKEQIEAERDRPS
jgi:hypothetical protein